MAAKFSPNSTKGLAAGDRVTLSNLHGDSTSVTIGRVIDSGTFENVGGTKFVLDSYSNVANWKIDGVEFVVPSSDGIYMSKHESLPVIVTRVKTVWFSADGKNELSEEDLLDLLPLFHLVTMNDALNLVHNNFINSQSYKRTSRNDQTKLMEPLKDAINNLKER